MRAFMISLIVFSLFLAAYFGSVAAIAPSASTTDNLNGIALVSSTQGWAVGKLGTIQHYDGSSWSLIASATTLDLFGVSFGPPTGPNSNAGFAVGGSGGTAAALYWGGAGWFQIASGLSGPSAQKLSSVFELTPTDAWAVDSVSGAFWHWSGSAGSGGGWNNVGSASAGLNSVFMTSPTDGWAVGAGGIIYRYSGGGWSLYTSVSQTLNSVFMVDQNEGWAVGAGGAIYHYSSGVWTGPISPAPSSQSLNSVFMLSSSEGWTVGVSGTVLHYLNGAWTLVQNLSGTNQDLNSLSFAGTLGWAVGNVGTFITLTAPTPSGLPSATLQAVYLSSSSDGWMVGCSTGGCGSGAGEPVLVHWNGATFTRGTSSGSTSDLYSVFMLNPSEGWAVGGIGTTPVILHYTGGTWTQVASPPIGGILRSVFMIDSVSGWAVGDNGAILRYSGGSWGLVTSSTSNTLRTIFMLGASDGWAAGDSGTILRYQGGLWVNYPSPTSSQLNSIYLMDGSHGWAVGASGTIVHFDGSVWVNVADPLSTNLNSVTQITPQQAWAVGDSGTILQWTGFSWYQFTPAPPLSGNPDLNSVYILSNGFGFVVGAPAAPGSQATVLQPPSMSPIPETNYPQILLLTALASTLISVAGIRRRKPLLKGETRY
jgi:photosystem II stability/assembly factor-like uncharacterized protein